MGRDDALATTAQGHAGPQGQLLPYVPRLALEWLARAPEERYRSVDGTMVFVDVSGFTALTERLARRGRAGAEELTSILDGVFDRLLTLAWSLGGGLVKFGGDALLLLFKDPGHASRAAAAAFDMRRELDVIGRIDAAGEAITLQMSVGLHSGPFDYFLVGRSHRELILTGPGATTTVAMEGAAEAGQILVSPGTAEALATGVLGAGQGGGWLLERRPDVTDGHIDTSDMVDVDVESCIPLGLRRHLASGARTPEHRVVTIAFLHFLGVDSLLAAEGPDVTADALEELVVVVQRHADEFGVTMLSSDIYGDGGKLILTAGAPEATPNDEERLLRAARAIMDEPTQLPLRIGINRGHVFAGDVGSSMRRTYTVMGDAMNLAARLMQAADPGQILATWIVLERSRTEFTTTPLPPFHVKGKARPVQAYDIREVAGWRKATAGARLPLIGRAGELDRLLGAAAAARDGRGQVVQLIGEAGIGKTRLVEELRAKAVDLRQYSIACEQYEASTPYWPFRLLLRRLLDVALDAAPSEVGARLEQFVRDTDPDLLPWLPLLAITADADVPMTPEVERLDKAFRGPQVERVTSRLLEHLLDEPTVVVFEDIYWLDVASGSLLRTLSTAAAAQPWLLLLTNRDIDRALLGEEDDEHVQAIRLAPLAPDEMELLAAAASELQPRPVQELSAVAARAGGSPLFLLELVAAGSAEALPDNIEAAITARLDTVDPPDRTLLRCAAVLGLGFPLRLAEETLPTWAPAIEDPAVWTRLDEFLVREGQERIRFRHALLHDVAYEGLPFGHRRQIHGAVADALERDAPDPDDLSELLALHFLRAERHDRAFHYARTAGDRARHKSATNDAAKLYRRSLDAAQHLDLPDLEVADVAEQLGDVSGYAGLYDDGARAFRLARRLVRSDRTRAADLLRKEGFLREQQARYRQARLLYGAGLRLLADEPSLEGMSVRAELKALMAATLSRESRYRAAVWWARSAEADARSSGARKALAHACYLLDWAYTDLGDPACQTYRELALPIYEELGDLVGQGNVLSNLGANAYYEGRWQQALESYERAWTAYERAGDIVQAAREESNAAEVLCQQGHLDGARDRFRESLRVFRGAGYRAGVAWVTGYLGLIAARTGEFDDARRLLTDARDLCTRIGADGLALEATAGLAEASLLDGDHASARRILAAAVELAGTREGLGLLQPALHRLSGYALVQAGDVDGGLQRLTSAIALAETGGNTYELALSLDAYARCCEAAGRPDVETEARAMALLADLGVVAAPRIPLPSRDQLGQQLRQASS